MSGHLSNARHGLVASVLLLAMVSTAAAQSVIDARRIEFTPSGDLAALDVRTGTPLIQNYRLDLYRAGEATVVQSVNLGSPAADPDGMIRVDFFSLLAAPLPTGVIYEGVVNGISPSESISSNRSNTFSFSADCTPSIAPTSSNFTTAAAANGTVAVTAVASCAWKASSDSPWITITAGAFGTGTDTVSYMVAANSAPTPRTGTMTIGGGTFTVTQAGAPCTFAISPSSSNLTSPDAGSGTVTVTADTSCNWTAARNDSWITVTGGANGSGNGTVSYSVTANTSAVSRTGTITIAGQTFTVTQPAPSCAFTISPGSQAFTAAGGTGTVTVTTSAECSWTASSSAAWVVISSGAAGTGSGTVTYDAAANTGSLARSTTLTIAGKTFIVTEASATCIFSLTPSLISAPRTGSAGTITVTTQPGCTWTASANSTWMKVSGSGTGSGTVRYSVQANNGTIVRSGLVSIGGGFVGVSQAGTTTLATPLAVVVSPNRSSPSR